MASVAVLTPTIEGREGLLEECKASVHGAEHLIALDKDREGPARVRNRLAKETQADWLLPLDDDDLLDADFFTVLEPHLGADVVYPWCRVEGIDWSPNRLFNEESLRRRNFIPVTALVRRELWLELGGHDPFIASGEDWDFWLRALDSGAAFKCVDEVLWTYRVGSWEHREPSWKDMGE